MEYLKGGNLRDYVKQKGPLNEIDAQVIVKQIALGIQYIHQKSLVHRDLKLENVVLVNQKDLSIKIVDLGIISIKNVDTTNIGSLHYMAPEIL